MAVAEWISLCVYMEVLQSLSTSNNQNSEPWAFSEFSEYFDHFGFLGAGAVSSDC